MSGTVHVAHYVPHFRHSRLLTKQELEVAFPVEFARNHDFTKDLDLVAMIRDLRQEKDRLDHLIRSLEELEIQWPVFTKAHRQNYSAKQQQEKEERMKVDWERRHEKQRLIEENGNSRSFGDSRLLGSTWPAGKR